MTDWFDQRMVPGSDHILSNMVVGDDASLQGTPDDSLLCYAICALDRSQVTRLDDSFVKIIGRYVTTCHPAGIEVHAKQIWNGSERFRTPFSILRNKDEMKVFLLELCREIGRAKPYIVVC